KGDGKDLWHIVDSQTFVAAPLERRDHTVRAAPRQRAHLRMIRVSEKFGQSVRCQHPNPLRKALLRLKLERMVAGIAGILVQTQERTTVLGIGQECLGNRGATTGHLLNPTSI